MSMHTLGRFLFLLLGVPALASATPKRLAVESLQTECKRPHCETNPFEPYCLEDKEIRNRLTGEVISTRQIRRLLQSPSEATALEGTWLMTLLQTSSKVTAQGLRDILRSHFDAPKAYILQRIQNTLQEFFSHPNNRNFRLAVMHAEAWIEEDQPAAFTTWIRPYLDSWNRLETLSKSETDFLIALLRILSRTQHADRLPVKRQIEQIIANKVDLLNHTPYLLAVLQSQTGKTFDLLRHSLEEKIRSGTASTLSRDLPLLTLIKAPISLTHVLLREIFSPFLRVQAVSELVSLLGTLVTYEDGASSPQSLELWCMAVFDALAFRYHPNQVSQEAIEYLLRKISTVSDSLLETNHNNIPRPEQRRLLWWMDLCQRNEALAAISNSYTSRLLATHDDNQFPVFLFGRGSPFFSLFSMTPTPSPTDEEAFNLLPILVMLGNLDAFYTWAYCTFFTPTHFKELQQQSLLLLNAFVERHWSSFTAEPGIHKLLLAVHDYLQEVRRLHPIKAHQLKFFQYLPFQSLRPPAPNEEPPIAKLYRQLSLSLAEPIFKSTEQLYRAIMFRSPRPDIFALPNIFHEAFHTLYGHAEAHDAVFDLHTKLLSIEQSNLTNFLPDRFRAALYIKTLLSGAAEDDHALQMEIELFTREMLAQESAKTAATIDGRRVFQRLQYLIVERYARKETHLITLQTAHQMAYFVELSEGMPTFSLIRRIAHLDDSVEQATVPTELHLKSYLGKTLSPQLLSYNRETPSALSITEARITFSDLMDLYKKLNFTDPSAPGFCMLTDWISELGRETDIFDELKNYLDTLSFEAFMDPQMLLEEFEEPLEVLLESRLAHFFITNPSENLLRDHHVSADTFYKVQKQLKILTRSLQLESNPINLALRLRQLAEDVNGCSSRQTQGVARSYYSHLAGKTQSQEPGTLGWLRNFIEETNQNWKEEIIHEVATLRKNRTRELPLDAHHARYVHNLLGKTVGLIHPAEVLTEDLFGTEIHISHRLSKQEWLDEFTKVWTPSGFLERLTTHTASLRLLAETTETQEAKDGKAFLNHLYEAFRVLDLKPYILDEDGTARDFQDETATVHSTDKLCDAGPLLEGHPPEFNQLTWWNALRKLHLLEDATK